VKVQGQQSFNKVLFGLTNVSLRFREQGVPGHLLSGGGISRSFAQHAPYAQSLKEGAVVEHPPDPCFVVEEREQDEEGGDGLVGRLEGSADVDGHIRAFGCVHQHKVVVIVAAEE